MAREIIVDSEPFKVCLMDSAKPLVVFHHYPSAQSMRFEVRSISELRELEFVISAAIKAFLGG